MRVVHWRMFLHPASDGRYYELDASHLDVSEDELAICIQEQIYGGEE